MPAPYMSGPHPLENAMGGSETCFEIRAPHRGIIRTIKFEQIAGEPAICDFEVYTLEAACPPPTHSSSSNSSSGGVTDFPLSLSSFGSVAPSASRNAYTIFGQKQLVPGTPFFESGEGFPYRNQDGTFSVPQNKLYVAVRPQGGGPKSYLITLEILTSPLQ